MITSNSDLDSLDPRVRSRLCDPDLCCHVFIEASDYRMRKMDIRFGSTGKESAARERGKQQRQLRGYRA